MMTTEQRIKSQFSKIFKPSDSVPFKHIADYYFRVAATIKKKNIEAPEEYKLWFRNVQKRLYIGIATEMLLKAIFLKNDFNINKAKKKTISFPEKIQNLNESDLTPTDTYTLGQLVGALEKVISKDNNYEKIIEGLNICKVFRNKEGHVAVHWHKFEIEDFQKIEYSIKRLYEIGFSEIIEFEISMTKKQKSGKFEKVYTTTYKASKHK